MIFFNFTYCIISIIITFNHIIYLYYIHFNFNFMEHENVITVDSQFTTNIDKSIFWTMPLLSNMVVKSFWGIRFLPIQVINTKNKRWCYLWKKISCLYNFRKKQHVEPQLPDRNLIATIILTIRWFKVLIFQGS